MTKTRADISTYGRESTQTDLFLIGAGVLFPAHLTLQTIEILTMCRRICTNLPESEFRALPKAIRSKCESLWPLYQENRDRSANYHDVAQAVINAARRVRPVAWMAPGHPFVFDSVSQTLLKAGRKIGWQISVVPGISCLDTILAELGYDPAGGLLIHEATSVVNRDLTLSPAVATLLLQPSAFRSDVAHHSGNWHPDLLPLQRYLLRFYAPAHDCALVRSSSELGTRSRIFWTKVRDLARVPFFEALAGSTLFLPAAAEPRGRASRIVPRAGRVERKTHERRSQTA